MTERERMMAGMPFRTLDEQLAADRAHAARRMLRLNSLSIASPEYRDALSELLPHASSECLIRPPFHCDYGYSIHIGDGGFINFNCVMLDGAPIRIGSHVLIGPAVQIYTFTHPLDFRERRQPVEQSLPVTVGDDCWIGGGAVICPGVTIGARSVVGAGSVVTKDVPEGVVVAGNPARIIRQL